MLYFGVKVKLNPVKELLRGKKVLIMEDSIIRFNGQYPVPIEKETSKLCLE